MPIHHREIYRAIPAGDGINGVQLQAYRRLDNSEINGPVTTATVGVETGTAEFDLSDPATTGKNAYELHPGPYRIEGTHNNVTRRNSSADHSKTGPTDLSALPQLARALGNGIIQNPNGGLNTGEVTADGATRTVTVATYAATVAGIQVENDDARTLVIAANASGSTRVDTIVTEMYKPGDDQEGRCTLKVVAGTLGAGAPALTDDAELVQFPHADVEVGDGVSVINQGNITDRRDYVERSVTAVEQDLVALEGRVADLEAAVVPRAQLIGYYQATWDPPNIAANSNINQGATITFADGYSALLETDVFDVSHFGVQANPNLTMYATKDENLNTLARVYVKNHSGSGINPASATLTILVYRLVLA